ncbi:MAG TPA: SLBB domain-containing protein [Bacteroidota bacterium]|nr:SLBB domain-containing protein [Bacteroidota bacterium]
MGKNDELDIPQQDKLSTSLTQPMGVALESIVEPEKYFVGPSDVISVNIWTSPSLNLSIMVTPEGTMIIPTIGELKVADLTLADAKEKILNEVRKKYIKADATVTLIKPRPIIVSVTGNVLSPGLFTLTSVDRANKAISEANYIIILQKDEREFQKIQDLSILKVMSTRNIILRHRDGSEQRVDLPKFFATKENHWNPYLREGDVIIVPKKNLTKGVFGIYGEVNSPGRYEYVEGDSLMDAIRIAYGVTRLGIADSLEFSRLSSDGKNISTRIINLQSITDGREQNFPLEAGDRIVVKTKIDRREDYRVVIEGEVIYPGTYPITKNETRLSDIIRQAGGFTEFASLKSAQLMRGSILPEEVQDERLVSLRGGAPIEDSAYYRLETELRIKKEIVNVDFEKLFLHRDSTQDVVLLSEDKIIIPSIRRTIYVFGQVVLTGHIPFEEGKRLEYYITKAGGYTERARKGDVKIVKEKTKQWLAPDETSIEEGDYIWVPKEQERSFAYYMGIASQAASVLSVIIGVAVIILQVSN